MTKYDKDRELLALLKDNARMPISELARKLNVSRTAAQARLSRLERSGVINGYTIRLSDSYQENNIKAIIMIKLPPKRRAKVEQTLKAIPELTSLYSISGTFDLSAIVTARSVPELDKIIDQIGALEGVEETQSSVILSTKIDR
jgi:DNA-binding Lrp family transcriptional regulator